MNLAELFCTPRGRVARGKFWMIFAIWIVLDAMLRGAMGLASLWSGDETVVAVFFWLWLGFSAASSFPMIALTIKRLHDSGRSGYWMLAPIGCQISAVMMLVAAFQGNIGSSLMYIGLLLVLGLLSLVVFIFLLLAGDEGSNAYGYA
ncbi:MAG: DUF805 domain-containing protein [Arenimonas sp.]